MANPTTFQVQFQLTATAPPTLMAPNAPTGFGVR